MKPRRVLILLVGLALVAGVVQAATSNIFRFAGASIHPTGDFSTYETESLPLGDGTTLNVVDQGTVEADSAFGFCLDFETRLTDRFGLGFTLMRSDHDLDLRASEQIRIVDDATGTVLLDMRDDVTMQLEAVDMTPLLVSANFHFSNSDRVDVYAGPFLGYITFGDIVAEGERVGIKDELAYGGTLGLDVPVGEGKMAMSAALRYMVAGAETDEVDSDTLDLDPFVLTFGVGYKF